jgi:SAM-dependent methyltransferase
MSSIDVADAGAAEYLREHRHRLIRSLSFLPVGDPGFRALELGSYLQMAAAMERVLHYRTVRAAYYSAVLGCEAKTVKIRGQQAFTTEVDLFDVESHSFPYKDSSFDVVLCCELIEHLLHDPMHMLIECWRVLGNNGLILLTTPNTVSLTSIAAALDGKYNPQVFSRYPATENRDTPHVREYTPYELSRMLDSAGFDVEWLTTERLTGAPHATWVLDVLRANNFDTSLRGEQIYCLGRKRSSPGTVRFPAFLYTG